MPVGPYETFDQCLADNQDKDDPGAFCAWLKDNTRATDAAASRSSFETVDPEDDTFVFRLDEIETGQKWEGVLTIEGVPTGDGRMFEVGAVRWEQLPVPLRWVREDVGEHLNAVVVGRIDQVWRDGGLIMGRGVFDSGSPDGIEAARQVAENLTPGVSVDLDDVSFEIHVNPELLNPDEDAVVEMDEQGRAILVTSPDDELMVTTDARLRAATIVATPAFADARIYVVDSFAYEDDEDQMGQAQDEFALSADERTPTQGMAEDAQRAIDWRAEGHAGGEDNTVERARSIAARESLSPETIRRMHAFFSRNAQYPTMTGFAPGEDGYPSPARVAWGLWGGDAGRSWSEQLVNRMQRDNAVTAGAAPVRPPREWLADPKLATATPVTVTEDGRIYGHLATWNTCHTGYAGQCVEPPASASNYAYFRTGVVRTADGADVPVGRITLDTTHAGRKLGASDTAAHYEHTGVAVADVAAGEDIHGIWIAGVLRPDVTPEQIRVLQASPLSGDWRRIGGQLELVAALAVNSPGFPIPRVLVAGGAVQTLLASGVVTAEPPGVRDDARNADDEIGRQALDRLISRERARIVEERRAVDRARLRLQAVTASARMRGATRGR